MSKRTSKLIAVALSLAIVLSVVPMFGLFSATAADSWDFYICRDYTGDNAPNVNDSNLFALPDTNALSREFVKEYAPDGTNWSVKLTASESATNNLYFRFTDTTTFPNYCDQEQGFKGMRMWIANPSDEVLNIGWQYVRSDGQLAPVQNNKSYYLQHKNSNKVYEQKTRTSFDGLYALEIPSGFEGWVYVSKDATGYGTVLAKYFNRIRFFVPAGKSVYTSRIECYSSTAFTVTTSTDYSFDTLLPNTVGSNDVSTNVAVLGASTQVHLDSTIREGDSGQSIKAATDTSSGAVRFRFRNLCAALANSTADGISFWIKNTHNFDLTLKITTDGGNRQLALNYAYYLKPDNGTAYTSYTVRSPISGEGNIGAIVVPANFEGRVYLPYSIPQNNGTAEPLKVGNFDLYTVTTNSVSAITIYCDGFRNYNFGEIGTLTTTTFDNLTTLNDVMWNQSGYTELSADVVYGNTGKSAKAKISSTEATGHRFKNLAPSADIATYAGRLGYRFWISNPNDFEISAAPQFFDGYNRALVGREYYLIHENGGGLVKKFRALHPTDSEIGCITIPANFRGYVYIPDNSIFNIGNFPVTNINAWTFVIAFLQAEADGYVYLDNYGMYAEEPTISRRQLPTIFSNGALFQQNKNINVWGFNLPEREVTAKLYMGEELLETVTATTNSEGRFDTNFKARAGGYDKYRMEFSDADGVFATVSDILIGELWLSAGQSNMEFIVGATAQREEIIANANNENLRIFIAPKNESLTENDDIPEGYWIDGTNADSINRYTSAVALVFAYELEKELKMPVGILNTAIGGTHIYEWFDREATVADADMLQTIKDTALYFELEDIENGGNYLWTRRYNTQIAPLAGLNIAGAIWYQGESDNYRYQYYAQKLDFLKESWGKDFGFENDDMPFIYTQVAPDVYNEAVNDVFRLGYLAEAMEDAFRANENNNTAMLTIYDVPLDYGNEGEIHPNVKIPVGERFAQSAINLCYNGGKEASAPIFDSIEVKGNTIYVNFTHVGDGLFCTGETIYGFNIAGEDGVYVNAKAKIIDKDTVMVWNDNLKAPKNVTYAFASMNQASNLVNSEGIPASPFRSSRDTATYMTIEEWMFADGMVWENAGGKQSGWVHDWTVSEGATFDYSGTVKSEGKSSLVVTRGDNNAVSVSPVINTYRGKKFNLANYNNIKLDVKANAGATIALVVNGTTYGEAVTIENDGFNTVLFALSDDIAANATVSFTVSGLTADVLYIDNIAVGMTDTAAVYGDVNDDGDLNELDIAVLRKHLLDIETEINLDKADANCDTNIDICDLVRAAKSVAK